jgi:hypothetical protein
MQDLTPNATVDPRDGFPVLSAIWRYGPGLPTVSPRVPFRPFQVNRADTLRSERNGLQLFGEMYCSVPTTVPCAVRSRRHDASAAAAAPEGCFASPKSSSFAPAAVNMMLPGSRSR